MLHHRTASRTTLTLSALCLLLACRPAATAPPEAEKSGDTVALPEVAAPDIPADAPLVQRLIHEGPPGV